MSRLHPSTWPLGVWVIASVAAGLLQVRYTLGSFSFAPAVALLAGTWLGARRGALSQAIAVAATTPLPFLLPERFGHDQHGFAAGLIAAAYLAGRICRPNERGAVPSRAVKLTVLGFAGASAALLMVVVPRATSGPVGVLFALTFLLGGAIAVFYAYRMVPEPGRVIGYAFCLIPYYAAGLAWSLALTRLLPASVPQRWNDLLLHAYLSHLPVDLIALVVIAYLVCAVDRQGAAKGPLAIGASR
jgi:hypothetical protein